MGECGGAMWLGKGYGHLNDGENITTIMADDMVRVVPAASGNYG